jgi:hypothetical protein
MSPIKTPGIIGQTALSKYQGYGLFGGVVLGFFVGVLLNGPHFYEWPAIASLAVVVGSAAAGALIGWLSLAIASGAVAGGGAWGVGHVESGDFSGAGDGDSGGSDGGDAC